MVYRVYYCLVNINTVGKEVTNNPTNAMFKDKIPV